MLYIYNIVYNIYMYIYINLCHTKKKMTDHFKTN